jgi:hypothetical protein
MEGNNILFLRKVNISAPVSVVGRSKVCSDFARSEAGILDLNPTQDMDVQYLCVRFSVFIYR